MSTQSVGTRFRDYQQYCDLVDEALVSIRSPLMNGLPMAREARWLIGENRLSFVKNADHTLIFGAHEYCFKLYYTAKEGAVLAMPSAKLPIVADQARLSTRAYPRHDALMERSSFTLERVNIGMERKLDDSLKRGQYVHEEPPQNITVGFAMTGECFKIDRLLRSVFDPVLDELPSRDELRQIIGNGDVFMIRNNAEIAATMVRIPKGSTAMLHWIAVDYKYRNLKLSGILHYAGDEDSQKRGYQQTAIWVNEKAGGWIQAIETRGYHVTKQRLYTYVYRP